MINIKDQCPFYFSHKVQELKQKTFEATMIMDEFSDKGHATRVREYFNEE